MMDLVDVLKSGGPLVLGFVGGWLWPRARRALRNRGKTEQEIAAEELDRALARAEQAHRDDNPHNDAAADAEVEARRAELHKIRRARAVWDGFTEDEEEAKQ